MPFDYYRIFYYVAKYKSFSKAAKFLHNNQPNITRCMNIMESELGCTLFYPITQRNQADARRGTTLCTCSDCDPADFFWK